MDKITKRVETLPERIDKLKNFIAIRRREITAYRAKLRAMKDIGMVEEEQKRVLNEAQNKAEEVLGAEAELGKILEKIPKPKFDKQLNGSLRGTTESLPQSITKKQSHEVQKINKNWPVVEDYMGVMRETEQIATHTGACKYITKPHITYSTGENEWYTPKIYINAARAVMGDIDVDPASSKIANEIVGAKNYYTSQSNGLIKSWAGRVWMNPPYSQPLIVKFSETFVKKYKEGEIKEGCVLVNNATDTMWLQIMLKICDKICFIKGRVRFIDMDGNATGAPLQGQLILYFGKNIQKFSQKFNEFGIIK